MLNELGNRQAKYASFIEVSHVNKQFINGDNEEQKKRIEELHKDAAQVQRELTWAQGRIQKLFGRTMHSLRQAEAKRAKHVLCRQNFCRATMH